MKERSKVLVTGITGFLGSNVAIQLLERDYRVVGSLRDESRQAHIRKIIAGKTQNIDRLSIVKADLLDRKSWEAAMTDIDYIMHVASPIPREMPKDDEDLILPAREGALNILSSAIKAGVKRVIMTSSTASVAYGRNKSERSGHFTETDWTDEKNLKDTTPYFRSKTIAEKAAWDFIKQHPGKTELSVICPGAILGPVLEEDFGTSANIVIKLLDGSMPAIPDTGFSIVDVRSVAEAHIMAMETREAVNQRFISTDKFLSFQEIAAILRKKYPDRKIPSRSLPDVAVRLLSNFDRTIKPVLLELGVKREFDNSKARKILGWQPIPAEEAVIACSESVLRLILKN